MSCTIDNRTFDIRPLNDIPVSERLRTEWMPRVMAAYEGALDWPRDRQITVASRLAVLTVNRLLGAEAAARWGKEMSRWAAEEARWVAAEAAEAAVEAGAALAVEAEAEARERIFIAACQLWIEAAS